MHLNAKGAPKPLPVENMKTKHGQFVEVFITEDRTQVSYNHEKWIGGKTGKQTKSAYKIPIDQPNGLYMSHLCSIVN